MNKKITFSTSYIVNKPTFLLRIIFFLYVCLLILKKIYGFQDGIIDVFILLFLLIFLLIKPARLVSALKKLFRENLFKVFFLFLCYFFFLSFYSYNTVSLIALEFLSVLKWLIYFFIGYLFAYTYKVNSELFPLKRDMFYFVIFVLIYSSVFYNWSGIGGGLGDLFGYYGNSFESIFSIRSVFAIFAFIVFVYALNMIKTYPVYGSWLLLSSLIFLFMSGNRKMLLAILLIGLFFGMYKRYKHSVNFLKAIIAVSIVLIMAQTVLFKTSVDEYSKEEHPRVLAYNVSYQIAADYFPFGSGPATFASKGSMVNYSHIYRDYDLDNVWGYGEFDEEHYYNDTYWAQVIGQYGVIGVVLFLGMFYYLYKLVLNSKTVISYTLLLAVNLFISLSTPALQRIEIALFFFFVMGMYAQINSRNLRNEK